MKMTFLYILGFALLNLIELQFAHGQKIQNSQFLFTTKDELYSQIMPIKNQQESPAETEKSFKVHLKDTFTFFTSPQLIKKQNLLSFIEPTQVKGKMTYASVIKKKYQMTVSQLGSSHVLNLQIRIKIYFKNKNEQDKQILSTQLKEASNLWNAAYQNFLHSSHEFLQPDFNVTFLFESVDQQELSDFSVTLLDRTDGPYDTFWSRDWPAQVMAHEIGHMMGLGDEYQTVSGQFDCLKISLMCSAYKGQHMPHHFYFILRRLVRIN